MTPIFGGPGVLADLEAKSKRERYVLELEAQLVRAGVPAAEREVKFHPTRKWRLDFAWPEWKVAIEYQGGLFAGAKKGMKDEWKDRASHRSLAGTLRDHWKGNEAQLLGWVVILANAQTVVTGQVLAWAERALVARGWKGAPGRPAAVWADGEAEIAATEKGLRVVARKGSQKRKKRVVLMAGVAASALRGVAALDAHEEEFEVFKRFVKARVLG
jgi:hypothetical protein